jgi:competence protein ComFA
LLAEIQETFAIMKLPIRYHQRPLIVPEVCWYEHWASCYQRKWKLKKLLRLLNELLQDNAVLVFCPSIAYMKKLYAAVKAYFPPELIACVSSQDEQRKEKVQAMRNQVYRVLFTTTILERGVTFEKVSVIIMGANHPIYTKSTLVQIAGRVDRKGEFNGGRVVFFLNQQTSAIRMACQEIKEMNKLAKRWRTNAL